MDAARRKDFFDGQFTQHERVALVAGAGGIGTEIACGLGLAGAKIALCDIDPERLFLASRRLRQEDISHTTYCFDLSDTTSCEELIASVVAALGRIDVLVTATTHNQRTPLLEVNKESYDAIMNANLKAPFWVSQATARWMSTAGHPGRIIHILSINATVALAGVAVYGMAKAAMSKLVAAQTQEWTKRYNIAICGIHAGFVRTPLTEPLQANKAVMRWIGNHTQVGNGMADPFDLRGTVLLLASPVAGRFIAGAVVGVDGGFMIDPWPLHT